MLYAELPSKWKDEARRLVKNSIDQWEEEVAREQGRKPIYYSMQSEIFKEELETRNFEIVTDDITKSEELIFQ